MANRTNGSGAQTGTATSRAGTAKRATRKATKARLALSGPSGSGKTWTALSIAEVLAPGGNVCVIDTEPADNNQGAASLYADRFDFDTIEWKPPYDPRDLALTISEVAVPYDVVIVDSASHFWRGEGGTLDIADGRFGGWKTATPAQDDMIEAILRAPAHVIICTRAKQSYEVSESIEGGQKKQKVEKLGLAPIQRDDMEYEFQVVVMIDVEHRMDVGKTRCHDLAGKSYHANDQGSFAAVYNEWLQAGVQMLRQVEVDAIAAAFGVIEIEVDRAHRKHDFAAKFGAPNQIADDRRAEVWGWLSSTLGVDAHPYANDDDETGACSYCGVGPVGGWHDQNAPTPETPVAPAAPAEGGDPPSEAHDEAPGPSGAVSEEATATPAEAAPAADERTADEVEEVIARVKAMDKQEAVTELRNRGQATSGNLDTLHDRLARAILAGVPVVPAR